MAWPNDCVCVQGIEQFIDPRVNIPVMESMGKDSLELPIWDQKLLAAEDAAAQEAAEAEAAKNVVIDPERVIKLVAQRTHLINQGYVQLTAYQIKSFYVSLDSLDKNWRDANVTLLFSHSCGLKSIPVPVLEMGEPVLIPSAVLVPGKLRIAAMATAKAGDYSVISTNSLEFQIYDPQIKPVAWPKMKDYDIYYMYQTLARQLLAEVKVLRENTPVRIVGTIPCYVTCTSNVSLGQDPIDIEFSAVYDKYSIKYDIRDFVIDNMNPDESYHLNFTLPNATLGITNITDSEYTEKRNELEKFVYVDSVRYGDLCGLYTNAGLIEAVPVNKIKLNLATLPEIKIAIPKEVPVTTLKICIQDLEFDREVKE